jgi:hypothetical protein
MAQDQPLLSKPSKPQTIAECHDYPNEEFEKLSLRERMGMYFEVVAGANSTLPVPLLLIVYSVFGLIWYAGYRYLVLDTTQDFWSEQNMRKFVLYNILHGLFGFGATNGPLGAGKAKVPVMANFLTALTPNSMCSPLFPAVAGIFQKTPGKRGPMAIITFIVYIASLLYCIQDPTQQRVQYCVICLFLVSIFDFVQFFASRGEHYGYHMICMMFPDWIAGAQWIQLMLWIMVGISKLGPWFKYAIQVLVKDAIWTPCLPKHFSARLFMKDWPRDYSPSGTTHILGHLGAVGEWLFPLFCTQPPGTTLNLIGVYGMIAYHGFIWATLPTASVFEWQYYTVFMTYFMYYKNAFTLPTSPGLIGFLAVVCFIIPVVGQLNPRMVPFLMAYRQYSGNWRFGFWVVKKSARHKLDKIPVWNPMCWWEAAPSFVGGERAEYNLLASFMVVPQFRGVFHILEKYMEESGTRPEEYNFISSPFAANSMFGWDLGVGWCWYRDVVRTAVVESCGFDQGECLWLQPEPVQPLPPHNLAYRLMDVTKGPMDAECYAEVPYSFLEQSHPLEVKLEPWMMKKGKSINGMFLTTYL